MQKVFRNIEKGNFWKKVEILEKRGNFGKKGKFWKKGEILKSGEILENIEIFQKLEKSGNFPENFGKSFLANGGKFFKSGNFLENSGKLNDLL